MSMRKAINNHCKKCIYDEYSEGTWRAQVEGCTSKDCSLYQLRPITRISTEKRAKETQK